MKKIILIMCTAFMVTCGQKQNFSAVTTGPDFDIVTTKLNYDLAPWPLSEPVSIQATETTSSIREYSKKINALEIFEDDVNDAVWAIDTLLKQLGENTNYDHYEDINDIVFWDDYTDIEKTEAEKLRDQAQALISQAEELERKQREYIQNMRNIYKSHNILKRWREIQANLNK